MAKIDDQVNAWLLEKFFERSAGYGLWQSAEYGGYNPAIHGAKEAISVVTVDQGWACGCYSSWTREDSYVLTATLKGERGEFNFKYGTWGDFPSFIKELDEYITNDTCYYESDEYDG